MAKRQRQGQTDDPPVQVPEEPVAPDPPPPEPLEPLEPDTPTDRPPFDDDDDRDPMGDRLHLDV
jgi:hypothetical protein